MADDDYLDLVKEMKLHVVRFRLVPSLLQGFEDTAGLSWRRVKFMESNRGRVPAVRGVYAFVVATPRRGLPNHGYVMYIGKAGDGNHSLQKRFADYLRAKKRPKRKRIYEMLNQWEDVLYFFYSPIPNTGIVLNDIEISLNDAMLPPMVRNDFSATIRDAINAFET